MRTPRINISRCITATLVAVSWLTISNHCALGLAAISKQPDNLSKHDCCANNLPVQPNPAKDPATPCCKTLLATSPIAAKVFQAGIILLVNVPFDRTSAILTIPPHAIAGFQFLDIGPPGRSFAESVLQEGLLAHAPPFLA